MVMIDEPPDLCPDCGHEGYDGHDMRSVPPACMTPGCPCGNDSPDEAGCRACGWSGEYQPSGKCPDCGLALDA